MPFCLPPVFCRTFFRERGFCPVFLFYRLVEIFYNGKMIAGFFSFRLLTYRAICFGARFFSVV